MSVNACPAKKERDASKKRGKNPFEGRVHPRGMLGKKSWNHGKTTPDDVRKKLKLALTNNPNCKGTASTPEKEALRRRRIREAAKKHGRMGGYRQGSGVGKKCWYDSPSAGHVHLQSTYELRFAQLLDDANLRWQRCYERFAYEWNTRKTYYIPDFVVTTAQQTVYVETKGFETKKDSAKWKSFPHKLKVLGLVELEFLEQKKDMIESYLEA